MNHSLERFWEKQQREAKKTKLDDTPTPEKPPSEEAILCVIQETLADVLLCQRDAITPDSRLEDLGLKPNDTQRVSSLLGSDFRREMPAGSDQKYKTPDLTVIGSQNSTVRDIVKMVFEFVHAG